MIDTRRKDLLLFLALVLLLAGTNIYLFATGRLKADWEGIGIMFAAGITISMYSFLYKDNVLFKAVEHLYVGVAAGYVLSIYWYTIFFADLVEPLIFPPPGESPAWYRLAPLALGIILLLRVSRRIGWISRISFAFIMGFYSGIAIPNYIQTMIVQQLQYTITPLFKDAGTYEIVVQVAFLASVLLYVMLDWLLLSSIRKPWINALALLPSAALLMLGIFGGVTGINQIMVFIGVVCVLVYFFFSVEHKGLIGSGSRIGIYFLMVSFGASFGYTIMARMSLLVERIEFLIREWLGFI